MSSGSLEYLTSNFSVGKATLATRMGRQYLVAPLTTIVPGVLSGSRGALYYSPEQIRADVSQWNGMPLTVYHPQSANGEHVSANAPGVLDRQGIGFVEDSAYNGKLQHTGWFDIERVRHIDDTTLKGRPEAHILPRLARGEPIELSTGLYTDNTPASPGASHNGVPYDYVAENYRSDHIAVLPDQVGACSLRDGCGVLVNESKQLTQNGSDDRKRIAAGEYVGDCPSCGSMNHDGHVCKSCGEKLPGPTGNVSGQRKEDAIELAEERTGNDLDGDDEEGESLRHRTILQNAFCSTGEGGGVDSSCSSSGGGSPIPKMKAATAKELVGRLTALEGQEAGYAHGGATMTGATRVAASLEKEKFKGSITGDTLAAIMDEHGMIGEKMRSDGRAVTSIRSPKRIETLIKAAKTGKHDGLPVTSSMHLRRVAESLTDNAYELSQNDGESTTSELEQSLSNPGHQGQTRRDRRMRLPVQNSKSRGSSAGSGTPAPGWFDDGPSHGVTTVMNPSLADPSPSQTPKPPTERSTLPAGSGVLGGSPGSKRRHRDNQGDYGTNSEERHQEAVDNGPRLSHGPQLPRSDGENETGSEPVQAHVPMRSWMASGIMQRPAPSTSTATPKAPRRSPGMGTPPRRVTDGKSEEPARNPSDVTSGYSGTGGSYSRNQFTAALDEYLAYNAGRKRLQTDNGEPGDYSEREEGTGPYTREGPGNAGPASTPAATTNPIRSAFDRASAAHATTRRRDLIGTERGNGAAALGSALRAAIFPVLGRNSDEEETLNDDPAEPNRPTYGQPGGPSGPPAPSGSERQQRPSIARQATAGAVGAAGAGHIPAAVSGLVSVARQTHDGVRRLLGNTENAFEDDSGGRFSGAEEEQAIATGDGGKQLFQAIALKPSASKKAKKKLEAVASGSAEARAKLDKLSANSVPTRSVWNKLLDLLTWNSPRRDPHFGNFIQPDAGTGRGDVHDWAVEAAAKRNDFADGVDADDENLDGTDRNPSRVIRGVPRGVAMIGNAHECSECGGKLDGEGECEDCGYVENGGVRQQPLHVAGTGPTGRRVRTPSSSTAPATTPSPGPLAPGGTVERLIEDTPEVAGTEPGAGAFGLGSVIGRYLSGGGSRPRTSNASGGAGGGAGAGSQGGESHTEVRSPTSTSTKAKTFGNITVTGGAGRGSPTTVHVTMPATDTDSENDDDAASDAVENALKHLQATVTSRGQHQASKEAAGASVMTGNAEAIEHGLEAIGAAESGDSEEATVKHKKTARVHDREAVDSRENDDEETAESHDVAAMMHRKAASVYKAKPFEKPFEDRSSAGRSAAGTTTNRGGTEMDRQRAIQYLTTNCSCWSGQDAILNSMPTQNLAQLTEDAIVANSARAGFKIPAGATPGNYVYNSSGKLVRNDGGMASADAGRSRLAWANEGEGADDEEGEAGEGNAFRSRRGKGLTGGGVKKMSENEWMAAAPPGVREVVTNAMKVNQGVRQRLIGALVENTRDDQHRQRLVDNYSRFSTESLQDAVAAMPTANRFQHAEIEGAGDLNFLGSAGGPLVNAGSSDDQTDVQVPATLNYAEFASKEAS